jgi:fumarate hydratase class I
MTVIRHEAYEKEQNPAAKDAMAQILINSRMCAEGHRPICQDTGIVTVFLKIGMNVQWESTMSVADMVNEGVRRAYTHPDNVLRASILEDPAGARKNTRDNTPAVIHYEVVEGDTVDVQVAAKGGGSENKSKMVMLNPSDSIVDWVVKTVPTMGAGWCPPGMLGIGIGGTAEKAAVLAKEALMDPIDIHDLRERGPSNRVEELRLEIMEKVNKLGIGAQGLGGLTTVMDVKIRDYPTHAASLPVAMIPNCAATRHAHFVLDGSGPAPQIPPDINDWPDITWEVGEGVRRVNLDTVTPEEAAEWQPGDTLLLSGKMLTGRDAAHKKMKELIESGEGLPAEVDLKGRFIYYVGPVDPVRDEVMGPAGPTSAGAHWPAGHDRQGGAGTHRRRGDQEAQGGLPDGGGRCCLPGIQGHYLRRGHRLSRTGNGGDLRVRGEGYAGKCGGGCPRHLGARDRPENLAAENRRAGHRSCLTGERYQLLLARLRNLWRRSLPGSACAVCRPAH